MRLFPSPAISAQRLFILLSLIIMGVQAGPALFLASPAKAEPMAYFAPKGSL
ncbi:hypothetical protein JCM17846_02860 [Iodidimonas nitroreducens]|uniref:Uncharacterized protein n=1 Tax=Iodidimonas nitroreducens TaxID=1236968 RepID=A0A5A7N4C2_9PROT|nr:hypothetical protein [Iodidimonas nitroreducens]GER02604.1 hypothetical protein JCM17846_02860 [Iodidimonas nitroreducens]